MNSSAMCAFNKRIDVYDVINENIAHNISVLANIYLCPVNWFPKELKHNLNFVENRLAWILMQVNLQQWENTKFEEHELGLSSFTPSLVLTLFQKFCNPCGTLHHHPFPHQSHQKLRDVLCQLPQVHLLLQNHLSASFIVIYIDFYFFNFFYVVYFRITKFGLFSALDKDVINILSYENYKWTFD